jgi:hypothetical protein
LSVEEQFYLAWPWLLLLAGWLGRRRGAPTARIFALAMAATFAASLAACVLVTRRDQSAAFYLMPFRAWEFAAGALGWLLVQRAGAQPVSGAGLAWLGLASVLGSICLMREDNFFPGWVAVFPALGSALLIVGTEMAPRSAVARLLSAPAMVWVGLLSYSLYLWHWPLFAFARSITLEALPWPLGLALSFGALLLAWASFRWVEQPIRSRTMNLMSTRLRTYAAGAALGSVVVAGALGLALYAKLIWPKSPANAEFARKVAAIRRPDWGCERENRVALSGRMDPGCSSDASIEAGILFWGDSHAGQMKTALATLADQGHTAALLRYRPSCPPAIGLLNLPPTEATECREFNEQVLREVLGTPSMRTVILGGRWVAYARDPETRRQLQAAIEHTVVTIEDSGRSVIIVAAGVEFPWPVPECIIRRGEKACGRSRAQAEQSRAAAQAMLAAIARSHPRLRIVDPLDSLCDARGCPVGRGGEVLYSDAHHLSLAGVRTVASGIARVL